MMPSEEDVMKPFVMKKGISCASAKETAPVVSVLIPYYNDAKYLPQAIESVLSQSYRSFELILVNHATTDNCREIAHGYDDPRIVHIDMAMNYGAGTGLILRKALEVARGKYFKPFCADDVMRPNCLGDLVSYMELHPEKGFAFGNVEYIDAEGKSLNKDFFTCRTKDTRSEIDCLRRFAKYESFLPYIGSIFRTVIVPVHDVDTVCIMLFDVSLWLRMLVEGHKIGFLNRIVSGYRIHEGQVSAIGNRARSGWLCWFEGEVFYGLFASLRDLDVAKEVFAEATYIEQMTDVADLRFVLSVRMMEQRMFANHQAYSYLRGLLNNDESRDYLERKYGFTIRTMRELYEYHTDDLLRGWYRRCGINDLRIRDALKVIFWHLYKICNPFSSLYKKRRMEKNAAQDQFSL